ncbi:MAG: GNAT family N-acetyltransferase [Aggregatilineales bacterium]
MKTHFATIRLIEELTLNAWPSLQTIWYDGWALRFAEGYTGRANSVALLYSSSFPINEKVAYCEQVYVRQGQNTAFKLTAAAEPGLDEFLAEQGYIQKAPTSVQQLDLATVATPTFQAITSRADLDDEWLTAYCALHNIEKRRAPLVARILNNVIPQRWFVTLHEQGEIVSVGMAVLERGYIGLYGISTAPAFRNRGLGRQLVLHLLAWGKANGATNSYLQVVADNTSALHLYSQIGFRETYGYWYRVKAR